MAVTEQINATWWFHRVKVICRFSLNCCCTGHFQFSLSVAKLSQDIVYDKLVFEKIKVNGGGSTDWGGLCYERISIYRLTHGTA